MQPAITADNKKRDFIWGIVFTTIPSVPLLLGIFNSFRGISQQKATGLGAVAGGVSETFLLLGMFCAVFLPVVAIVKLAKSFTQGESLRKFFSVMAMGWCLIVLLFFSLAIWTTLVLIPRVTHQ